MNVIVFFEALAHDLRYGLRGLLRRPEYSGVAALTLALGIGATTAIFSVVYSVLIKPLPYPDANELVRIRHSAPGIELGDLLAAPSMYLTYEEENQTFAEVGIWQEGDATLIDRNEPERVRALRVSDGTLQALAVQPALGRWFNEQEHGAGEGPEPVILSHGFWQRRFGGDSAVLDRDLLIDSRPSRVVGVMPADFGFLDMTPPPDVILAVRLDPARQVLGAYGYQMLARLKSGVTATETRADVERMLSIWIEAWPLFPGSTQTRDDIANLRITPDVRPLKDDLVGSVSGMMWVLMSAVGVVLLVACGNVANLMLVRADARRQDVAVRVALGAKTARVVTEILVESLVPGGAGAAFGLVLAYAGIEALVAIGPGELPRLQEVSIHPPVLAFTVIVSLASALLLGSIMAVRHAAHPVSVTAGSRGVSMGRERTSTRSALVIVQVAFALVLVVSAALMIRTSQALAEVDPGFTSPETVQTARIWVPTDIFPDRGQYTQMEREIRDSIAALPGVVSVGFANAVPMESAGMVMEIAFEDQTIAAGEAPLTRIKYVSPGYFEAMGTELIAGRSVAWSDIESGGRVAVVSEDFARWLAPTPTDALGKRIRFADFGQDAWREVVGVVQNVRESGLYETPVSMVYWPVLAERMFNLPVSGTPSVTFAVRSERAGTATLMEEIRQAVRAVSESIPIGSERTMRDLYAASLTRTSFTLVMLSIAGGMALLLGAIGVYSLIAYLVSQRNREIGIRAALGARPRQLMNMFLFRGLTLAVIGVSMGVGLAMALERFLSSLLFGIRPVDPAAYVAAMAVTFAISAIASYSSARRAATIDPVRTLKME